MIVEIIAAIFIIAAAVLMLAVMVMIFFVCCGGATGAAMVDIQHEDYGVFYDDDIFAEEYERLVRKGYGSFGDTPRDN